jgi:stearoyl-CoA desaturase (delta-9 desaturase)
MLGTTSFVDRCLWRLGWLDPATPLRVNLPVLTGIAGFHLLALLGCVPWLFSWSGVAWTVAGLYLFGTLGINIGYHRLVTHRGFTCPPKLEHALCVLGVCCWQGTPMSWVAMHRMHHQHSDEDGDPHSPRRSFFWSHMGWFLIYDPAIYNFSTYERYVRDLVFDRFYKRLERPRVWRMIHMVQWASFFGAGAVVGGLRSGTLLGAVQLGLSWLVWGVFVRTVAVWHITWSVNSLTHLWGYRTFETRDDSRNNWLVGVISNGEGWHNNHHAEPRCAAHGQRWWELDVSYLTIRALEQCGFAREVVRPRRTPIEAVS